MGAEVEGVKEGVVVVVLVVVEKGAQ
jgi:hypothetical protein